MSKGNAAVVQSISFSQL